MVNGTKYSLTPMPIYVQILNKRLGQLLGQSCEDVDSAQKTSKEAEKLLNMIFEECVSPKPVKFDSTEIYGALIDLTNDTLSRARCFREGNRDATSAGGVVGAEPENQT